MLGLIGYIHRKGHLALCANSMVLEALMPARKTASTGDALDMTLTHT